MDVEGSGDEEVTDPEPTGKKRLDVGAESIASLSAKILKNSIKKRPQVSEAVDAEEEDEEEVPILINRDLPNLQSVLDKADVVIEVLDARDPLEFRSAHLESIVQKAGKKLLFVLSKIGTYFLRQPTTRR